MKALALTALNTLEFTERPDPVIKEDNEVLIRMKSVGICGSDIHYFKNGRIGSQIVNFPLILGHEGAGIIEKVGKSVTNVKPGDHVAIDPAMPCMKCDQCKSGRFHTCRHLKFLGCPGQADGCLSEFIVMPSGCCFPLNSNLTLDQGALSEPLAIGVYAAKFLSPSEKGKIGILGSGPVGISVLLAAKAIGVKKIYATDLIDERLKIASELGAYWTGNANKINIKEEILEAEPLQLDAVYECCGKQEAIDQAIYLLKPGGKLLIVGIPAFNRWSFDVDALRRKEIIIQNVRRQNESVEETLTFISEGKIKPDRMQTHTFNFNKAKETFQLVAGYKDGVMKAMINF